MTRVGPFYSTADDTDPDVYHVCTNCPSGQNILSKNKGTGIPSGYRRCDLCDDLIDKGTC